MDNAMVIKPKEGLGELPFGAGTKEVEKYFGPPEEVENIEDDEECTTKVWHYWSRGFSLFFNEEGDEIFTCVEIDDENAVLWEKEIFKMKEKEIISLFRENGYKEMDSEVHEWGEKRVSFDDALVDLYFEDNSLVAINYGIVPEDKKFVIFPN